MPPYSTSHTSSQCSPICPLQYLTYLQSILTNMTPPYSTSHTSRAHPYVSPMVPLIQPPPHHTCDSSSAYSPIVPYISPCTFCNFPWFLTPLTCPPLPLVNDNMSHKSHLLPHFAFYFQLKSFYLPSFSQTFFSLKWGVQCHWLF